MSTREDIFESIERERDYQNNVHAVGHNHTVGEWLIIMDKKIADAKQTWYENGDTRALLEILKVISTGVACLEQHYVVERVQTVKFK